MAQFSLDKVMSDKMVEEARVQIATEANTKKVLEDRVEELNGNLESEK